MAGNRGLAVVLLLHLLSSFSAAQQQITAPATCSGLVVGPTRLLSSLSPEQLGALASTVLDSWDFQGRPSLLTVSAGANVTLSCLVASNVTVAPPSVGRSAAGAFLQPTALDLSSASGLAMSGVSLDTDCATVLAYQQHLCTSLAAAGSLTLEQGAVRFSRWRDGFTALDNVNLTCPSPNAAPQPPCRLVAVQTAQQLLEAFTVHAVAAAAAEANLTIVIAANISITNSAWPSTPVLVQTNVTMVGSSLLRRPVLDFNAKTKLWDLESPNMALMRDLTLANLAPSYFSPGVIFSQFGMLSERVWAFRRSERLLHLVNVTLVVPPEQLSYTKYWVTYLVSPVPEAQDKAAWIRVGGMKIAGVNVSGVYYDSAIAYTVTYTSVRITDTVDSDYPLIAQNTGVRMLRSDNVPLVAANPANSSADLLAALAPVNSVPDDLGRRWVLLAANISMGDGTAWPVATTIGGAHPAVPVFLASDFTITQGAGLQAMRLGLGGRVSVLGVPYGTAVVFRHLVLSDLGTRGSAYDRGDPLAVLFSPLWGLDLAAGASKTRLENCTVLVSADELRLLQQALMAPEPLAALALSSARPYDQTLMAAVRTFFTSTDTLHLADSNEPSWHLRVVSGATLRYGMSNVLFRTAVTADGEVAAANLTAMGVPYDSGLDSESSGMAGWLTGVIVGCVVGGVLLLVLAPALLVWRRRQLPARRDDSVSSQQLGKLLAGAHLETKDTTGVAGACDGMGQNASSQMLSPSTLAISGLSSMTPPAIASVLGAPPPTDQSKASDSVGGACTPASAGTKGLPDSISGSALGPPPGVTIGAGLSASTVAAAAVRSSGLSAGVGSYGADCGELTQSFGGDEDQLGALQTQCINATAQAAALRAAALGLTQTDSFNRPPTTSMLGVVRHAAASSGQSSGQRTHSGHLADCPALLTAPYCPSVIPAAMTPALLAGSAAHSGSGRSGDGGLLGVMTTPGSSSLDQMHQVIAALGRDFNTDRQLTVHGLLGKGAHGTVYRATWRGLAVAVKSMTFGPDDQARHQQRPLMEAAISSNLAHANIVTTYSYELREVQHELASLSPEPSQQGGGWRLLIIQEFCDAGPLRRLVDCGFFLTPPRVTVTDSVSPQHIQAAEQLAQAECVSGAHDGEGSDGGSAAHGGADGASRPVEVAAGSCGANDDAANGNGGAAPAEPEKQLEQQQKQQAQRQPPPRPALEEVPADVPGRPGSSLQAALRYVEAALMIARGLQHIHDKNIVHGDLNPNNVLLVKTPDTPLGFCLKVADFGLSVRVGEGESHLSNLFQGSPYYCAPEVVMCGKVGKSADLYSLGIMLWELQNGTRPSWRMGVRLRTYPSLNTGELEFGPDTPPRYARLARDCFRGSSSSRPGIAAVVSTLEALLAQLIAACTT